MRLKELESLLQDLDVFEDPKVELEQYPTGPHLAARLLHTADASFGGVAGRAVLDLGTGTGVLALGAALLGARHVLAVDVDADALAVAAANAAGFEGGDGGALPVDFLLADVRHVPRLLRGRRAADAVVANPPFGTRRKGADTEFVLAGLAAARAGGAGVFSLHKTSTREHLGRPATLRGLGAARAEVLAQLRYDLPASYAFHRQRSRDIDVDLWRFEPLAGASGEGAARGGPRRGGGSGDAVS